MRLEVQSSFKYSLKLAISVTSCYSCQCPWNTVLLMSSPFQWGVVSPSSQIWSSPNRMFIVYCLLFTVVNSFCILKGFWWLALLFSLHTHTHTSHPSLHPSLSFIPPSPSSLHPSLSFTPPSPSPLPPSQTSHTITSSPTGRGRRGRWQWQWWSERRNHQ